MCTRHVFWIILILLQPVAWGEGYSGKQPGYSLATGSCVDRCHVNYLAYRTMYRGKVFKHKSHSPALGLECGQCHNNNAVNVKTHGGLIIQNKDCGDCHHKQEYTPLANSLPLQYSSHSSKTFRAEEGKDRKENVVSSVAKGCLRCHADAQEYMDGSAPPATGGSPDWMSGIVSCTDCHKKDAGAASFKAVRERCVECHNADYGLLYDAWKETLNSKIKQSGERDTNLQKSQGRTAKAIQSYGMHNFRLSQTLLRQSMR